jgi:diguanylate cyclase (GGDEF)-like protein
MRIGKYNESDLIATGTDLEEKLLRMTSLFDSQVFETLSGNTELVHRYILDTIEFVFGRTSTALMLPDEGNSSYTTAYSTGKHKEILMGFRLDTENPVITNMLDTRAPVFTEHLKTVDTENLLREVKVSYFYPLFIGCTMAGVIWILDRKFSREDVKIMNACRDYYQLNLENQNLRVVNNKIRKADETLSSFLDFSESIVAVLDKERFLNTMLEKSMQLAKAEQGSLMLLNRETSELVVEANKSVYDTVQEKRKFKKGEGITGIVFESGSSLLIQDMDKDPRVSQQDRLRYKTKSIVSVPIKIEGSVTGVLNLSDKIECEVFNEDDLHLIKSFINYISIAIERSLLFRKTEELEKLSITDPLTGIYNRRYLNSRLSEEIVRYSRYKHPFSLMMFDLDGFKEYNAEYGHISGDKLLKFLVKTIEKLLRTTDIAARFGGDEFVVIFPRTPKVDAIPISNRIKENIDKALREYHGEMPLTVSMGLTTYPDDASSVMELFEKTDQALYYAKKGGGSRVVHL